MRNLYERIFGEGKRGHSNSRGGNFGLRGNHTFTLPLTLLYF